MRLLTVAFGSPAEFLSCYSAKLTSGGLFCPTRARFAAGEDLVLDVGFPGLAGRTMLRGRAYTGASGRGGWVGLARDDVDARDYLLAAARSSDREEHAERCHLRLPVAVPVACEVDEVDEHPERVFGQTLDLGGGGVFIR